MIIVAVIFLLLCFAGVIFLAVSDEDNNGGTFLVTMAGIVGFLLLIAGITQYQSTERPLSDYSVRMEIRTTITNGVEISKDTVYVITQKRKK